jgi:hypothetical protein
MTAELLAATISFVGLALFTTQPATVTTRTDTTSTVKNLSNTSRLRRTTLEHDDAPAVVVVLPRVDDSMQIDAHHAIMTFRACDFMGSTGWTTESDANGNLHVSLEHEVIHFETDGTSVNPPIVPQQKLPHLPDSETRKLAPRFRAPDYEGAAAAVVVPYGTMNVCRLMDTAIVGSFNVASDHSIVVVSGAKRLRLKPGADIVFINLPTTHTSGMKPHWYAYCVMTGNTETCNAPVARLGKISRCSASLPLPRIETMSNMNQQKIIVPSATLVMGFECSNSQFP